jgi:hypothetical protein
VKILIGLSVNINPQDKYGLTPLHFGIGVIVYIFCKILRKNYFLAVMANNLNLTNTLIKAGGSVDVQAYLCLNQWTPLHFGEFFKFILASFAINSFIFSRCLFIRKYC